MYTSIYGRMVIRSGIGVINENNEIIIKKEHDWTTDEKENLDNNILDVCIQLIKQIIEENNISKIEKIGIGYPCKSIINGVVYKNENVIDFPKILTNEFKVPTYLKNDVKCSAICEKTIGNLKDYNNCIFMTLGTGIGGAYFYKNELVTPNTYQGFEIGHMVIEVDGRKCRCGRKGCFEEYGAMRVFRKEIEELFNIEKVNSYKMF